MIADPELYDAGETILTALAGAGAGLGLQLAGLRPWAVFVWLLTIAGTALKVTGAMMKIARSAQHESLHELTGCLETLIAIVNPPSGPDYDPGLRATLHVSIDEGARFEQVLDYVGDDRAGRTAGRKLPGDAGLLAIVLQTRTGIAASREIANHETYVRELQEIWNYSEAEARRRDMSAMSWIAVPLESAGVIGGVLFLDSLKPRFFDNAQREAMIVASTVGIAKFAARRYTHES